MPWCWPSCKASPNFFPSAAARIFGFFPGRLDWPDGGIPFDVALHAGTLLAVVLYFPGHLDRAGAERLRDSLSGGQRARSRFRRNRRLFWLLVIGTIPGAIVGSLFERFIEETWRNPGPIAAAMIGVALLMWSRSRAAGCGACSSK